MRKKIKRRRRIIAFSAAIFTLLFIILHFQRNVNSVIISISSASVKALATIAVNEAVYVTFSDGLGYNDLVTIEKDAQGKITNLTTNSFKINQIARDTAYLAQKNLKRLGDVGIYIPLGALTGAKALAGFGPKINIKIIPIGNVSGSFISTFRSAGINQTNHRIILEVVAEVNVITPSATSTIVCNTEVLICESLIVGEVPKTLLTGDLFKYNLA